MKTFALLFASAALLLSSSARALPPVEGACSEFAKTAGLSLYRLNGSTETVGATQASRQTSLESEVDKSMGYETWLVSFHNEGKWIPSPRYYVTTGKESADSACYIVKFFMTESG